MLAYDVAMRACMLAYIYQCMRWPCGPACMLAYDVAMRACLLARIQMLTMAMRACVYVNAFDGHADLQECGGTGPGPARPGRFDFSLPGSARRRRVEAGVLSAFW